jgi:hypothetical protein
MSSAMLNANVDLMNEGLGFDVVVVCTSTEKQANYWQMRLEDGCGTFLPAKTHVLAVHEDWEGGAGNALGTLYAYQKAIKKGADLYGIDFDAGLQAGSISIGLYHSAGKGTRLAPMPGAENNNKPGVKLCASVRLKKAGMAPITILESVIKQTGCYAQSRRGRLSVFWGDQIFVPSVSVPYTPTHHADILCKLGPMVDEAEWAAKGLQSYGLIVKGTDGEAAQVEKVDHPTAMKMLKAFGEIDSVGASLGSFSVSAAFVSCLMTEFAKELQAKTGKMDSDPHLWMPMTLERDVYVEVMQKKSMTKSEAGKHFDRVRKMIADFRSNPENTTLGNFGAVNIGPDCSWWDYGMLKLYQKNNLLMIENSEDGALMRKFFRVGSTGFLGGLLDSLFGFTGGLGSRVSSSSMGSTFVDASSIVQSSTIGSGSIKNCIVNNVRCNKIDAEGAILVNVTADSIVARNGSIVYNTIESTLDMGAGDVCVGVADASGTLTVMNSAMDIDGGKVWDEKVKGNAYSFGDIYKMNGSADPIALEDVIKRIHSETWNTLKDTSMSFSSSFLDSYWAPVSGIAAVAAVASVAAVLARRK